MFGIRFIKSQPTTHLMQFRAGRLVREGAGLSFFYYAPRSSLVAVPMASRDAGFMLELVTSDFQGVTVQGEVTYRVGDPARISRMMDFSLTPDGRAYNSEDPERLQDRVVMQVRAIVQQVIQALPLRRAIQASAEVARAVQGQLGEQPEVQALGLEILGVAVVAIRPTPDIARALEAEAREANLKVADDAISQRRMAGVQNERAIRQTELDTEIAVELKRREIQQTQLEARAAAMRRENELRAEQMGADIELENQRKAFVASAADNTRHEAEAQAHKVRAVMDALQDADPRVVQALAAVGMQPGQLIAQAFGGLAERAERIGQLNLSPELLSSLMASGAAAPAAATGRRPS
jgi:hypothetical protein